MFEQLKKQVSDNFNRLAALGALFYITINRDRIWEEYLDGFDDPIEKQGHNCNCCKSFLRQYAGIVAIQDNKVVSIWDGIEPPVEFEKAIKNLKKYIHSQPITDVFVNDFASCGTDQNFDVKREVTWKHFHVVVPQKYLVHKDQADTIRGEKRDNKAVLKRSLDELTIDATETILDLIAQGSLYRGNEHEGVLKEFLKIQKQYSTIASGLKDNFCWLKSTEINQGLARIRNTALGTLLIDLSEGMELDTAVSKFEKVMAPTNYKRPTALITPKMVENAKEKLAEMGLMDSLERRYANEADVSLNDIIFTDKSSTILGDVFDDMSKGILVNPRTLSKVEEISMDDFIHKIVPSSKAIHILLENSHLKNMVSLITSNKKDVKFLFKWENNFSWNYTGGITDSIKERVKAAGGNVDGELRVSLSWHNHDDLDLHVIEPNGISINFSSFKHPRKAPSSGVLDVDMNAGSGTSRNPVENIIWTEKSKMQNGNYKVIVHNFAQRERNDVGFTIQIECGGEIFDFEFNKNPRDREHQEIVEFSYDRVKGITFKGETKSNVISKEKWNLKTNQFHRVNKMMLSPNYWNNNIGNKHYLFFLEGCISDESPRPFFNEFLKQEFDENRKVFEIMGSKIKIDHTDNQLSGVGFSDTQDNSFYVKVKGAFERTLKVKL